MYPIIFSLYGPLAINSYGFFIAIGVMMFIFFVQRDKQCMQYDIDKNIIPIVYIGSLGAFFGGKIVHYILKPELSVEWFDIFLPWHGGFSILGSIVGAIGCLLLFFSYLQTNILRSLDCLVPYIPLLQSIGRIGCFFAGCCYGKNGHLVQLYSAMLLFGIFLVLYKKKNESQQEGSMLLQYIMLVSFERFFIDYWRAERFFGFQQQIVSHSQWIALLLFFLSALCYIFFISNCRKNNDFYCR